MEISYLISQPYMRDVWINKQVAGIQALIQDGWSVSNCALMFMCLNAWKLHIGVWQSERKMENESCEKRKLNEWEVGSEKIAWLSSEVLISDSEGGVNGVNRVP